MSVVKPTIICCVPMILEKVYRKQVMPMLEKGPMSIAVKIPLLNTAIYSVIRKNCWMPSAATSTYSSSAAPR